MNLIFLQGKRIKINYIRKIAERFQFFQYFWLFIIKEVNINIKSTILVLFVVVFSRITLIGGEGMWILMILQQMNKKEMQEMGMKIKNLFIIPELNLNYNL